jgi:hypothetical protein
MKNLVFPALMLASLLSAAGSACAGVVFATNLPKTDDITANLLSDQSSGPSSVTFTAAAGYRLTRIEWWGFDALASGTDAFEVTFNGATLGGTLGDLGEAAFPNAASDAPKLKHYYLDVTTDVVSAGSNVLSVFNESFDAQWLWQFGETGDFSYRLTGEPPGVGMPEPTSLALVLAALAAACSARRRSA